MVNFLHEEDGELCNKCDHVGFWGVGAYEETLDCC